ncbi:MAG: OmpH family outer membrane protein [candidate division Zixibacteria bacterium]|nr:OmpH family outer membrane protein [candidate division Zixibacteria bacterium]
MPKVRNLLIALAALSVLIPALPELVSAQGMKLGFVKDERIKDEYKAWGKAQEQWDLESKAWEDEALAKQTELQEMVDEYEKQKLILSEDKKREREAAIRTKEEALDAFTRQVYGPGGTAERKHAELLQPLLERITKAIEAVAIEGDYDVIFTLQSGLGYIKEDYDVTDKVLKYLEDHGE